jgi:putative membrane protein
MRNIMSKTLMLAGALALAMTVTAAQAQSGKDAPKASKADQQFVTDAVRGDMAEVNIGKLAQQNGGSADVKSFGQMLEQDHGQHLTKAQNLAQQLGVTPPNAPSSAQKATYDKLSKLNGASFDRQFAAAMVKDHKEDIAKYEKEAKSKGPAAGFAQETVPVLQKHLQTAQSLASAKQSSR